MIDTEILEWCLFGIAPIVAVFTAKAIYNALAISRRKELRENRDEGHYEDYLSWWELVNRTGLKSVFCPMTIEADEVCYYYAYRVSLYEPGRPSEPQWSLEHCVFDVPCGTPVGRHWSVLDGFDALRFVGKGSICVTNRHLYFRGLASDLTIAIEDLHTVAASCSGLLLGVVDMDRPLLFDAVNGQKMRDILHLLRGDEEEEDEEEELLFEDAAV